MVTIDTPDEDDSMCSTFSIAGRACGGSPNLVAVTVYLNGEEVDLIEFDEVECYDFDYEVYTNDFPVDCGEVEIEVVAEDIEGNEASEKVDVFLCNDTTDPEVNLTLTETVLYPGECTDIGLDIIEENFVGFQVNLNGILWREGTSFSSIIEVCTEEMTPGENTLEFTANDVCGNTETNSAVINWVIPADWPWEGCSPLFFPEIGDCLCGSVVFRLNEGCDIPEGTTICFYFDGEDVPRHTDSTEPYEYEVNVNDSFEPETHVVWLKAILDDGTEGNSESVSWVKSCDPHAVLQVVSIDNINRIVTVNAGLSSDDNVEPGLTFDFIASPDNGCWIHDQVDPSQSLVTFTFDTEGCEETGYVISVTVFDGWCNGRDTASVTVSF